ncbi:MAG: FtsX-like permease family protein, partial [SAR202 cluster bacterium]|nr:FtsX-like permease family protein [SAR202 cluster bacterium]
TRRPGQTALIIIGVMLSTTIISAAFGTGDTLSFSIRNIAISDIKNIDEIIVPTRAGQGDSFDRLYMPYNRFEKLRNDWSDDNRVDGMMPQLDGEVPSINHSNNLSDGQMHLVGIDPQFLSGFSDFMLISGEPAHLAKLGVRETYANHEAAVALDLSPNDVIDVYVDDETISFTIKGVVENGGFAGIEPTLVMTLTQTQTVFGQQGKINRIVISNRGGVLSGNNLSDEVTKDLRIRYTNRETVASLKEALAQAEVVEVLKTEANSLRGALKNDFTRFLEEIQTPYLTEDFVAYLVDDSITTIIFRALESESLQDQASEIFTLFTDLTDLRVLDIKNDLLQSADEAGSFATTFFITFSLFSIASGILLIFLIFVLLAGARKSEMGMARAVGAKRRHLIQMFTFEGTAYALVSAAIGVILGLIVSALMIRTLNTVFASGDDSFRLIIHFEPRTIIVSYTLGMVITFGTVAASAYRVSNLNIVAAIRDLPERLFPTNQPGLRLRLLDVFKALIKPLGFLYRTGQFLSRLDFVPALVNLIFALLTLIPVVWLFIILVAIIRLIWPALVKGWLTLIFGIAFIVLNHVLWDRTAIFGGGVSLTLTGIGLMTWTILKRLPSINGELRDRIVFTGTGIAVLLFWMIPSSITERTFLEPLIRNLEGGPEVMFSSGISMVGASVWTVMYNADPLLRFLSSTIGTVKQMRPILITAVAYPLNAKFRTGMTLSMFALVIFTLMVMSVLTETFGTQFVETRRMTGGWDIIGRINIATPIDDIQTDIQNAIGINSSDFEAVGGYTSARLQMREQGGNNQKWHSIRIRAADERYLNGSAFDFKLIANGYGPTNKDVLTAVQKDPTLVVIGGFVLEDTQNDRGEQTPRTIEGIEYSDTTMPPINIDIRDPSTGSTLNLTIIGVLDRVHEQTAPGSIGIIASKMALEKVLPFNVPIETYSFRMTEPSGAQKTVKGLQSAFLEHGMEASSIEESLNAEFASSRSIMRLFTAFMALGLFVGIAALGVLSTRAVVERRQQIGVLRAIGYKPSMIQLSLLLESSFISILGMAIGTITGLILSWQAVTDIRDESGFSNMTFSVPLLQIGLILSLTLFFALLATYLPARAASKIYPAEALRYE